MHGFNESEALSPTKARFPIIYTIWALYEIRSSSSRWSFEGNSRLYDLYCHKYGKNICLHPTRDKLFCITKWSNGIADVIFKRGHPQNHLTNGKRWLQKDGGASFTQWGIMSPLSRSQHVRNSRGKISGPSIGVIMDYLSQRKSRASPPGGGA